MSERQQLALHGRGHGLLGADPTPPGKWIYVGTYPGDPGTTPDSPPFENSWVNVGGGEQRLRFRLTNEDSLEVEGEVEGGDIGTTVTTVADPYRPDETRFSVGAAAISATGPMGAAVVVWKLDTTGELSCLGGAGVGSGGGGGSIPDPSLEPDNRVLETFAGAAIWASTIDGGSA